jgi:XTP/dITP diphosphohydrolase
MTAPTAARATRPLVFATRNRGKLRELRELVPGVDVVSVDEAAARLGRDIPEVEEDRDTFLGNAEKKAIEVALATGWPALADDSGLEVDALGGAPGVYSARFGGAIDASEPEVAADPDHGADAVRNRRLLAALEGVPAERRTARFRCVLVLADPAGPLGDQRVVADGTCEGVLLDAQRGSGGFGYDPLFLIPSLGQTFAELPSATKAQLGHRGRAMAALRPRLLEYLQKL